MKQIIALSISLLLPHVATATFSIAGTDNKTNQVGAAGASCVPVSVYELMYNGVPDHGVLITQATPPSKNSSVYSVGKEFLANGTDPKAIIDLITSLAVDNVTEYTDENKTGPTYPGPEIRQYGVVDLMGRTAGYSPSAIKDYYYDLNYTEDGFGLNYTQMDEGGSVESYAFSAQGNIVTDDTVPTLAGKFVAADTACDLAGRLFGALEAVFDAASQEGGKFIGDVRCAPYPAGSAFIHVDNADGTEFLHAEVIGGMVEESPFPKLKAQYDTWRSNNPCKVEAGPTVPTTVSTPTSAGIAPAQAPAPTATNTSTPTNGSSSAMSWTSVFSDSPYLRLLFSFLLTML